MIGASVFTVMAATKDESTPPTQIQQRACDLPLYDNSKKEWYLNLVLIRKKIYKFNPFIKLSECKHSTEETTGIRKTIEDGISIARTNACQGYNAVAKEAKQVEHFYASGKEQTKCGTFDIAIV